MKKFLLIIFVLIFISCDSDNYSRNLATMSDLSKKQLEDAVFKDNGTISFLEFIPIEYQVISEYSFDSSSLIYLKSFYQLYEYKYNQIKQETEQLLTNAKSNPSMMNYYQNKGVELNKKMKVLDDSYESLKEIDSLFTLKITTKEESNEIFRFRFFIKATITEYKADAYPQNIMDTICHFYDKDFNIKEHPDFENQIKDFKSLNKVGI